MDNGTKSFFSGLIFGLTAGAIAGILLAPKSGKETREDIKKLAIEFGEKVSDTYMEVKAEVEKRLAKLKAAGKKIDWGMYKDMVNEVLNEFKNDGKVTVEVAERMGTQLGKDWDVLKTSME